MPFVLRKFTDEIYFSFRVQRIYLSGIKSVVLSKINLTTSIICGMILGSIRLSFSYRIFVQFKFNVWLCNFIKKVSFIFSKLCIIRDVEHTLTWLFCSEAYQSVLNDCLYDELNIVKLWLKDEEKNVILTVSFIVFYFGYIYIIQISR